MRYVLRITDVSKADRDLWDNFINSKFEIPLSGRLGSSWIWYYQRKYAEWVLIAPDEYGHPIQLNNPRVPRDYTIHTTKELKQLMLKELVEP